MITGGKRWRRYEISATAPAYRWSRFRATGYPDKARQPNKPISRDSPPVSKPRLATAKSCTAASRRLSSDLLRRLGVSARVLQSLGRLAGIRRREHTHPHQLSEDAALAAL